MVRVAPVARASRTDFEALFSARGCPGYCWCAPYRFPDAHRMGRDEKRDAMLGLIEEGVPVGLLAYDGKEPVGWCSIAPRRTFPKLARSKVMPEVDADAWTVTCLFVRRDRRGTGLARRLVEAGLRHAAREGAHVVEAYPFDTAGISSRHWGHSSLYRSLGFERDGRSRRWVRVL